MIGQVFIHDFHHLNVLGLFGNRLIIQTAPVHTEQLALPAHGYFLYPGAYQTHPLNYPPSLLKLFFKNSFSTLSWPIWAYSSWVSMSGSSVLPDFSNTDPILASNSAFQREIMIGLTSKVLASSASVF